MPVACTHIISFINNSFLSSLYIFYDSEPFYQYFRNILGQLAGAAMPQAVSVTPEEREAIERVSLSSCNIIDVVFLSNFLITKENISSILNCLVSISSVFLFCFCPI